MRAPVDNEPETRIKGGPIRTSIEVDRAAFPALVARRQVTAALRAHDPDSRAAANAALSDQAYGLVRVIAQEASFSNVEPTLRYNAIASLGARATAENLNLLVNIAHFGEDFYVRGHALLGLGAAGLEIALPAIAQHLGAREPFERTAARRAVSLIAARTSIESVLAQASLLDPRSRSEVGKILTDMGRAKTRGEPRRTPARRRPRRK
jgi:HEAT repeat protein